MHAYYFQLKKIIQFRIITYIYEFISVSKFLKTTITTASDKQDTIQ